MHRKTRLRLRKVKKSFKIFTLLNILAISVFFIFLLFFFALARPKIKVLSSNIINLQTVSTLQNKIEINFSGRVDKNLVEKTLTIYPAVLGVITWENDRQLEIQLQQSLSPQTKYQLSFSYNGAPLPFFPTTTPEIYNLQFETGDPPQIINSSPYNFEKNVRLNKYLVFDFNQEVSAKDFENYFFLKPKIKGTIVKKGTQLLYIPRENFAKNTRYFTGVLKGLPGADKQQLMNDYFMTFQTEGDENSEMPLETRTFRVPILMYHNVGFWAPYESELSQRFKIEPQNLEEHLKYISENYQTISMKDLYGYLTNGVSLPENPIILTFDDGWRGVYTEAFPLLKKYNLHFTTYLITSHYGTAEGYLTKKQIQEMITSELCEIGNHTVRHPALGLMDRFSIEKEIEDADISLKKDFGVRPETFSYPGGSYNKTVLEILEKMGYKTAVTVTAGSIQNENELLLLKRIAVDGGDGVEELKRKLDNNN